MDKPYPEDLDVLSLHYYDIFQAIEEENIASCKSLIKSLPDINGLHPDLHIGVIHASSTIPCTKFARDLFRTLVKWNVDVNALTGEGYSPLDIAVSNDRLETTKFLLKHGAQPSDRTLELAQEFNNASCEKLIQESLASVSAGYDTDVLVKELKKLGLNPGPITKTTKPVYLRYKDRHMLKGGAILSNINKDKKTFSPELELILSNASKHDLHSILVKYEVLEEELGDFFQTKYSNQAKTCFTYLLLNSQVTNNLPRQEKHMNPLQLFKTFLNSIFYIGKGTNARPYAHLHEAKVCLEKHLRPKNEKTRKIISLWNSGIGVVCLTAFRNVCSHEALSREAAMILALRLENLTNEIQSNFAEALKWSGKRKCQLGGSLLYRCFRILMSEGERPLLDTDIG
ncbi:hypothetical protein M8J76_005209 [Diaphorina citri]|nr:hypothetical protein M8J75_000080 [Diaphorina citri]KAI5740574.1 hypothetical protein M8J76_005209 [Diaphorina citri]